MNALNWIYRPAFVALFSFFDRRFRKSICNRFYIIVICMSHEINNTFEIIVLLFWANVQNKAWLPQLLSPFASLVQLKGIKSYLDVVVPNFVPFILYGKPNIFQSPLNGFLWPLNIQAREREMTIEYWWNNSSSCGFIAHLARVSWTSIVEFMDFYAYITAIIVHSFTKCANRKVHPVCIYHIIHLSSKQIQLTKCLLVVSVLNSTKFGSGHKSTYTCPLIIFSCLFICVRVPKIWNVNKNKF